LHGDLYWLAGPEGARRVAVKSAAEAQQIIETLGRQHPNADTELCYGNAFELLVAAVLSAQTTDAGVNRVTPNLFARYPDAPRLAAAEPADLEALIQATGFFRQKARALLGLSRAICERHGGQVPRTMEALVKLPGVGRKTANVVLGHALGVPGLPVDRHVLRVSNRIGLARSVDPERVEQQLCGALPLEMWTRASDTLILHGRRICKTKPLCERCTLGAQCEYRWQSKSAASPPGRRVRKPAAPAPPARTRRRR
jgi:endonuclease-3